MPQTPLNGRASVGRQVRAPKTAELIAAQLRSQVVRGELTEGDTLPPEMKLMEQYGVSRPTLREAFRILETESLIRIRRGSRGGARVVAPDLAVAARYIGLLLQVAGTTIADVYEARIVLESAAVGRLAERRTAKDLAALEGHVDHLAERLGRDEDGGDVLALSRAAQAFHQEILAHAGNRTLAVQAGVLTEIVDMHLSIALRSSMSQSETRENLHHTVRVYRKLLVLIAAGDADGAEKHWRTHMELVCNRILGSDDGTTSVVDLFT